MTGSQTESSSSFTVHFIPQGDSGAAFHLPNSPGQIQRPYIFDIENSDLLLQGNLVNVIHGFWSPDSKIPATIIITDFQFLGGNKSRHFRKAVLNFKFSQPCSNNLGCPEVISISPFGHFSLNVSQITEEKTQTTEVGAEVTPPVGGMKLNVGHTRGLTQSTEKGDRGTVIGVTRVDGKFTGPSVRNTARWSLAENESQGDGLPSYLRVAVLLKRKNNSQFHGDISVKAEVDVVYTIKNSIRPFLGHKIDPIIFDPTVKPFGQTPGGLIIDPENLSETADSIDKFCAIRDTTLLPQISESTEFAMR